MIIKVSKGMGCEVNSRLFKRANSLRDVVGEWVDCCRCCFGDDRELWCFVCVFLGVLGWVLSVGCWVLEVGCWGLEVGGWVVGAGREMCVHFTIWCRGVF